MFEGQQLEMLAVNEYRLLELPAVTRRAQQDRELRLGRDASADAARSTPLRRLRQALARAAQRPAASQTTADRI